MTNNLLSMITNIGDDATLLTKPDAWLEMKRRTVAANMSRLAQDLESILKAQKLKAKLQQENLVAVQEIERSGHDVADIAIKVMPLSDAIKRLDCDHNDVLGDINAAAQTAVWLQDGYDIEASRKLIKIRSKSQ